MRWFVGAALALVLAWASFLASPYLVLLDVAGAVEHRDAARLAARLNMQALRTSFAKQLAGDAAATNGPGLGSGDRQMAAAVLSAAASPLLDGLLTPGGIGELLRPPLDEAVRGRLSDQERASAGRRSSGSWSDTALVLFQASRWRGFRNVYFSLPLERPIQDRVKLQLRLSRFKWRIVSAELPRTERERLSGELAERAPVFRP